MTRLSRWALTSVLHRSSFIATLVLGLAVTNVATATTASDTPTPSPNATAFINVKAAPYNAMGDGCADDTIALQKALDAAATLGLGVYMPGGDYRITKGLTFHHSKQLTLIGNGPRSTVIYPDYHDAQAYVLDIRPESGPNGPVVAALLEHFRIEWTDTLSGLSLSNTSDDTWSNGIRLSGVSGSTLINNLKMKNGPGILLHFQSGTVDPDENYYPFLEHFTVENSAFLGRAASNPQAHTDPVILADGPEKILQVRFQRNLVGAEGQARNHIRIVNGEQWTISDNKFRNTLDSTCLHIGSGKELAPTGFRIYSNGFENIRRTTPLAPPSKDQAILYLQGDSGHQTEHPFIGHNTFIYPSIRDIFLENIQSALVVEQGVNQNEVHLLGELDRCRDNRILAFGDNLVPTEYANSFLYSNNNGMAATSGFSAYRNNSIRLNPNARDAFFEWGEVDGKGVRSPYRAITQLRGGSPSSDSVLETQVDGIIALTLSPTRATVNSLGVGNSVTRQAPVSGPTAHAIEVFDENGNSLGYIPVYADLW